MIRIGRGKWKGHLLRPSSTLCRPTSSLVRGAFLDICGSDMVAGATVWDLCAGTGAVGIEALSWGAAHCVFVDRDPASTSFIRNFLRDHDARESATVITGDIRKYISRADSRPGLVFIDPPYSMSGLYRWIRLQDWAGMIHPGGAVFIECGDPPAAADGWQVRKYGDSYLEYLITDGGS